MTGLDLRILRMRKGLKQFELAALLGIPQTTLSRIEHNQIPIDQHLVKRVLSLLTTDS